MNWFSTRVSRPFNTGRIVFPINGDETIGYPHAKESSWTFTFYIYKISWKWIKNLRVRAKTIKLLGKNVRINPCDLGLVNSFLAMTLKA